MFRCVVGTAPKVVARGSWALDGCAIARSDTGGNQWSAATVTIGQVIDRTGSNATPSWADSIRLAVGTANQALKQARRSELRFEVAEENSGNAPEMARAAALRLKQQGVRALITDSSQDAIAINMLEYDGDPAHALDMPVVCMACTTPAINDPRASDPDPVTQAALRNGKGWTLKEVGRK
jgi:hypothetical protein